MKKPNEKQQNQIKKMIQSIEIEQQKLNVYLSAVADGLSIPEGATFDPELMEFKSKENIKNDQVKK